jgi:tetratricopeptide (TPR) repeat protein
LKVTPDETREFAARVTFILILGFFSVLVFSSGGFDAYPRAIFEICAIFMISALVLLRAFTADKLIWSYFDLVALVLILLLFLNTVTSALPGISLQQSLSLLATLMIVLAVNRVNRYLYVFKIFRVKISHEELFSGLAVALGLGLILVFLKNGRSNHGLEFLSDLHLAFININHNAAFLSLAAFCGLFLLLKFKRLASTLFIAYLNFVLISFMLIGGSSGATFAFFVSFSIVALISYRRKNNNRHDADYRLKLNIIYILPFLGLLTILIFGLNRGNSFIDPQQELASFNTKTIVWAASAKAITGNLLLGNGLGTFRHLITAHLPTSLSRTPYFAESDFMHLLFETGLLFTLLFSISVIIVIIYSIKRASSSRKLDYRLFFSCGILALMIHGLVDIPIHVPALTWFFAITLGLLLPRDFHSISLGLRKKVMLTLILGLLCSGTLFVKAKEAIGSIYYQSASESDLNEFSLFSRAADWDPYNENYVLDAVDSIINQESIISEDVGRALYLINRALTFNPLNHALWSSKAKLGATSARLMNRLGLKSDAAELEKYLEAFDRAITLYPSNAAYTLERAMFLAAMGEKQKAIHDIQLVFSQQPKWCPKIIKTMVDSGYADDEIIGALGDKSFLLIELGKQRKNLTNENHSIELFQRSFTAAVDEGNFDNAVTAIKLLLGCNSFRSNRSTAIEYLARTHFYHPEIWNISLALGQLYLEQNERATALEMFKSCTFQKNNWQCPFAYSRLLIEKGEKKQAFDHLLSVIEHPKAPTKIKIKAEEMRQRLKYSID